MPIRRGFTLVELLVVVGIIIILMGLLVPAIGMVSQLRRKATTRHTMDQLGAAIILYFNDYAALGEAGAGTSEIIDIRRHLYDRPRGLDDATHTILKNLDGSPVHPVRSVYDDRAPKVTCYCLSLETEKHDPSGTTHRYGSYLDGWNQAIKVSVSNELKAGRVWTSSVELRSYAGTFSKPSDDVTRYLDRAKTIRWTDQPE